MINPESFLEKRISFLKWNKKEYITSDLFGYNSKLEIKKQKPMLETPYSFNLSVNDDEYTYNFPEIMFGIDNDTAYIYAIQNKNKKEVDNKLKKKINRLLFKLNANFSNEKISDVFNSEDVTMSFVAIIIIFIKYLKDSGITAISTQINMPIRYNSHIESTKRRLEYKKKIFSEEEYKIYKDKINMMDILYNDNVFMKLIRTIYRTSSMGDVIKITDYPLNYDSNLKVKINDKGSFNNELANDLYSYEFKSKSLHY